MRFGQRKSGVSHFRGPLYSGLANFCKGVLARTEKREARSQEIFS